jgi:hypothetical protein
MAVGRSHRKPSAKRKPGRRDGRRVDFVGAMLSGLRELPQQQRTA